jgi:hypothetical protein
MSTSARQHLPAASRSPLTTAGRTLTALAALTAAAAALSCLTDISNAGHSALVVQTWRMYGLLLCAGLFALLARRPQGNGGLWALAIANKLALTLTAICFTLAGGIAESASTLTWDGALTITLATAYLLCRTGTRKTPR